ncbi:hypothetical protein [Salinicoccus carnicancri]|uniref:hypothetical protein n=1 Tax=Salinicoccus carnicancri TaxID=558170 RepID=UPI0002E3BC55|nr:hypothetical protein [Salinicoccus carnicancri]
MIKEIEALNADTGTLEHYELHKVNYKKKNGEIDSVELFQNGSLETYVKTGNAIFYSDYKAISIPAYQLKGVR